MKSYTEMAGGYHANHIEMDKSRSLLDMRRRTFLRGAIGLGIIVGWNLLANEVIAGELKVGQPAPPLVLHTLDGKHIATGDLHGQVVIATFWATWCEPCRVELPLLSAYAARHATDG